MSQRRLIAVYCVHHRHHVTLQQRGLHLEGGGLDSGFGPHIRGEEGVGALERVVGGLVAAELQMFGAKMSRWQQVQRR
jgi:hypothetical protein